MVLEEGTLLTFILATGLLTPHVTYHFCDLIGGYIPVYGNYDTSPEKVRMTRFELLGDFLKRFQNPGLIVNRSIKLIRLKHTKKTWYLYYIFKRGWSWGCERTSKHKPLRDRSWAPDTWRCPGGARRGPCRDTPSAPERVWWARQSRWKLSQTSPTRHLGLGTPHLDPQWPVWDAVSDWKHPKKQTIRVKISHWICDLKSIKKGRVISYSTCYRILPRLRFWPSRSRAAASRSSPTAGRAGGRRTGSGPSCPTWSRCSSAACRWRFSPATRRWPERSCGRGGLRLSAETAGYNLRPVDLT